MLKVKTGPMRVPRHQRLMAAPSCLVRASGPESVRRAVRWEIHAPTHRMYRVDMNTLSGPVRIDPTRVATERMAWPTDLDLAFEGWSTVVFEMLDRLRAHPHIEQYRKEKPEVRTHLKEPFKRYRDDVVVNWVLPNRLDFETEKNVFARLLKNDFGAGGCKDTLWMAFYRPGRTRLRDVQISHSISPDGFDVGVFVGGYAKDLLAAAKERIAGAPDRYLALVNPLLQNKKWQLSLRTGSGKYQARHTYTAPLDAPPGDLSRATDLLVRCHFPRTQVLEWGAALVEHALRAVRALWPLYRFYLA